MTNGGFSYVELLAYGRQPGSMAEFIKHAFEVARSADFEIARLKKATRACAIIAKGEEEPIGKAEG